MGGRPFISLLLDMQQVRVREHMLNTRTNKSKILKEAGRSNHPLSCPALYILGTSFGHILFSRFVLEYAKKLAK
jgi:hypothetical protein